MMTPPAAGTLISALRVGADIESISQVTSWLADLAEREEWPMAMRFGLELSVEEALTNVISYGFDGIAHDPVIRLEVHRMAEGRVAVELIDNGAAFDPTTLAEPEAVDTIDAAKVGGHGVQLMRHFLESLTYRRQGEENHLTMVAVPRSR
ncbi:ATP-binding protein [Xanthobacter agilis]|jgi:anti-sigma regulatory factor (Ser/Thr protein kinase)|uniref:Anti-sigma regulatory factor (Ser/Thr protein kinase) n=1 Tax=Xanthobacter agilis TaxID=47492 RepID=A0ABU0LGN8_XANAG|nr:ATP-binding protein [Xanthobacter agilis]MDQ0506283.1 anti-sigma regulatory factor (Ser/Thr protein kinase) [Xanthobacter agilis]